ncbi:MAG: VanZ family protein [Bacillota bacterium]|nr:VanZ family protein [Bacillota bacterium]
MKRQIGEPGSISIIILAVSYLLTLLWMGFIFQMSAQAGPDSNDLSAGITEIIVETIERVSPQADISVQDLHRFVRKYAHFFSYLVLGLLMVNSLTLSRLYAGKKGVAPWFTRWPYWRIWLISLGVCVLFAISDEIHQLFVPGRGCQVTDMLIDSGGSTLGIGIYAAVKIIVDRKKKSRGLSV